MILISHRGNINEKKSEYENTISYIEEAINSGFEVEIDIRLKDNKIYLGHDEPQTILSVDFIQKYYLKLWLHCKDLQILEHLYNLDNNGKYLNYFWHETDALTITSKGYLWTFPGKQPIKNSIAVLPELYQDSITACGGICSDVIINYKDIFKVK